MSMDPLFYIYEISLAVRGVIIAIPHVRAAAAKGPGLVYEAAIKPPNPIPGKTLTVCGEMPGCKQVIPGAKKLCGWGTSADGVLISRAITERPDPVWRSDLQCGLCNAMRLEFSANGPANIPEFGTVKTVLNVEALCGNGWHAARGKGANYPAVICIGGWNDYRVVPWQPAKFAAAVQNASASGKPVLTQ